MHILKEMKKSRERINTKIQEESPEESGEAQRDEKRRRMIRRLNRQTQTYAGLAINRHGKVRIATTYARSMLGVPRQRRRQIL